MSLVEQGSYEAIGKDHLLFVEEQCKAADQRITKLNEEARLQKQRNQRHY